MNYMEMEKALSEYAERVSDITGCSYWVVMDIYDEFKPDDFDQWLELVRMFG